jgi:hypothetical protein
MEPETLYEGPAPNAIFYLPAAGTVRFAFSNATAAGYVRSRNGALARVEPGARLSLTAGEHVLILYSPSLMARVKISLLPN